MDADDISRIDRALVHLRRLWSGPSHLFLPDGQRIEMSSLLVLEAWAQLAPDDRTPVSVKAIRRFAAVQPSTATRLLDRAVAAGVLTRVPGSGDGRQRAVIATPAGRTIRTQAVAMRTAWLHQLLASWPQHQVAPFAAALERFAEHVQAFGGPDPDGTAMPVR